MASTPLFDQMTALLSYANGVTGAGDTRLGDAVRTLADGYGQGGGGVFGMLSKMHAYGTCSVRKNITARLQPLYISFPPSQMFSVIGHEVVKQQTNRPVYLLQFGGVGSATNTSFVVAGFENINVAGNVTEGHIYTKGATAYGVSQGQRVSYIPYPQQVVSAPSAGYDLTIMTWRKAVSTDGKYPAFDSAMIDLGDIPEDTWVDVGSVGKIYIGFTAPTLD